MSFSEKLYELRKKVGLSQKEFAKKLGVAQVSINYWEKGQRTPSIDMFSIIADYFGVSLNYLRGLEEDKIAQKVASWGIDAIMAHSKEEKDILENCKALNSIGQQKVANYAKDLTKVPEYRKNAAHADNYANAPRQSISEFDTDTYDEQKKLHDLLTESPNYPRHPR